MSFGGKLLELSLRWGIDQEICASKYRCALEDAVRVSFLFSLATAGAFPHGTGSGIGSLHQHLSVRKRKQRKGAGRILEERRAYVRCATQRLCPACPWKRFCPWHQRSTTHSFLFCAINQVSSKHIINCFQHIVLQPAPTEEPGRSAKFDFFNWNRNFLSNAGHTRTSQGGSETTHFGQATPTDQRYDLPPWQAGRRPGSEASSVTWRNATALYGLRLAV